MKPAEESNNDVERVADDGAETPRQKFKVRRRLQGRRLDTYVRGRCARMSRTAVQRLIKEGAITVNGLPAKPSYEPGTGDIIEISLPPRERTELIPEDIPLDIIYEDDHLLAINKRTGIICHPARATQTGTIANAVAFYADQLSAGSDPFRPGIIHRLDKNTTGVMLIAKTDEAHWRVSLQFEKRTTQKTYFGIVEGEPRLDGDIIDRPLAAHPTVKGLFIVPGRASRLNLFKEAVTRYEVVERFKGFSLVHMHPKTGRTHQLRVHMSSIGHPMMGDTHYGGHICSERDLAGDLEKASEPLITYQSLHALKLRIMHPIKEEPLTIEAPLSPQLQRIVDLLRKHRSYP